MLCPVTGVKFRALYILATQFPSHEIPGCATLQKTSLRTGYATQEFRGSERSTTVSRACSHPGAVQIGLGMYPKFLPFLCCLKAYFGVVSRGWTLLESEECNLIFRVRTWQSVGSPSKGGGGWVHARWLLPDYPNSCVAPGDSEEFRNADT